jgi:hypothetical protein
MFTAGIGPVGLNRKSCSCGRAIADSITIATMRITSPRIRRPYFNARVKSVKRVSDQAVDRLSRASIIGSLAPTAQHLSLPEPNAGVSICVRGPWRDT